MLHYKSGDIMKKDTSELITELQNYKSFKAFYNENSNQLTNNKTLSEYLNILLEEKGLKKAEVIRKSELNDIYGFQIFSGVRVPERKKLLCLAIGMGLDLSEVQTLLKCSGYAQLYIKTPFDCVIIYGICNKYTVAQINSLLYEYDFETLG